MALMQWIDEKYSTKVDVCDTQHKELFNRVNALNDAVSTGARQEIGTTLDNLIDYVVVHFETEERLMEERGYKGLDAHKEEHKQLVQTCADLQKKFHAGEAEIEDGTMVFIKNWLDHHIPVIDKSYSSALSN
ncbi:MAG: bacteriohemerythrin [Candidatus Thiodiazotropha taylori]|uniref:Bacteriohemerythrin n=1 Tax=Candidatus Thiodiazotropha taylori TaxID=2792791 RepID=A0A9E4N8F9_9GAMM|nr:bacteriohemerythrin [Candidatus Thiodiazotropha taylori]MCG7955724.1 bacteriohemerythrin [Candidatus Thiodiazotropha taylori]MCG7968763.1 bacteriohemerythrin [Candidatus Thiodiazotropha taylori]MCG8026497.1 bacteriohemerythrin [Candidatus Thiodiazotropha taylori]MCG8043562.1 bacteriohemerythrin [Candidatus Thiodiazotropha taylori]